MLRAARDTVEERSGLTDRNTALGRPSYPWKQRTCGSTILLRSGHFARCGVPCRDGVLQIGGERMPPDSTRDERRRFVLEEMRAALRRAASRNQGASPYGAGSRAGLAPALSAATRAKRPGHCSIPADLPDRKSTRLNSSHI